MLSAFLCMLAGIPSTPYQDNSRTLDGDSLEVADSILFDSILASLDTVPASFDSLFSDTTISRSARQAAAALKRDTTVMDSLELAIYLHNKAVDDSLALDSINRQRKHGIDSPVEFSANDSLLYEAGHGMAYLFGNSHVKYQNMDLQSENIYLSLDSSLVHATGARDSVSGKLFGNPVFQMGSDTYQSDTMAFNFKTKKGFIQQVYTEQQEGRRRKVLSSRYIPSSRRATSPVSSPSVALMVNSICSTDAIRHVTNPILTSTWRSHAQRFVPERMWYSVLPISWYAMCPCHWLFLMASSPLRRATPAVSSCLPMVTRLSAASICVMVVTISPSATRWI